MKIVDKDGKEHNREVGSDTIGIHAEQIILDYDDVVQLSFLPITFLHHYISILRQRFVDLTDRAHPYSPKHHKDETTALLVSATFRECYDLRNPDATQWLENGSLMYIWHGPSVSVGQQQATAEVSFNAKFLGDLFVSYCHQYADETRCTTIHHLKLREWVLNNGLGHIMFKQEG